MIRTQIQLTKEQSDRLKEISASNGVSVASLIRESIDQYLVKDVTPSRAELFERATEAIGMFSSGDTDVSENHDKYLAEIYAQVAE
jgi:predicted DNA-binding protein